MNILIIGSGPQALFVLRTLANAEHNVTVLSFERKVASYSRHGVKIITNDLTEFAKNLKLLMEVSDKIFVCGGKELQYLLDEYPIFFESPKVYPKPYGAVKIFSDKLATYKYMEGFGLQSPRSYSIEQLKSVDFTSKRLIVKWNQEAPALKVPEFKTEVFSCFDDIISFIAGLDVETRSYLVIQDYIVGNNSNNISLQLAFGKQALKGSFIAKKSRVSKNGYSSYVEEIEMSSALHDQVLVPITKAFLALNYDGLAEVEFKVCSATGGYYLIEVNPRPCGLVSALSGKYSGVSTFLEGGDLNEIDTRDKVRWTSIMRDVQTCLFDFKISKSFSCLIKDLRSIWKANSYDIFDATDLKPFFSQLMP